MDATFISIVAGRTFPIYHKWIENGLHYAEIRGTGFFINDKGYFLSVQHVFSDGYSTSKFLFGGIIPYNSCPFKDIEEIYSDASRDIYLGRVLNCSLQPIRFRNLKMNIGEDAFAIGYPNVSLTIGKDGNFEIANIKQTVIKTKIEKYRKIQPVNEPLYTGYSFNDNLLPGISGGPCFDSNGYVFGVAAMSFQKPNEQTGEIIKHGFGIDIFTIKDVIAKAFTS